MRVLVIGASGFTGRRVLAVPAERTTMLGMARSPEAARIIDLAGAEAIAGDLDDRRSLDRALRSAEPDVVITVASLGFGHVHDLIAALLHAEIERCVFTSTTGIFTALEPASKQRRIEAEAAIESSGLAATIIRPTMIYGRDGDRNMERLLRWLHRVPVVVAPNRGRSLQQPVHVDDLADALVSAASDDGTAGMTINVPGPRALPFAEIVRLAGDAVGCTARVLPLAERPLRGAVALQERVLRRPVLKSEQIDRLTEDKSFDPGPAAALLGLSQRSFADGIRAEAHLLGFHP